MTTKKFTCHNCGTCCGPVMITKNERKKIEKFLLSHREVKQFAFRQEYLPEQCVFRDNVNKKCLIYSCRPAVCKIYKCKDFWNQPPLTTLQNVKYMNALFAHPMYKKQYEEYYRALNMSVDKLIAEIHTIK